MNVRTILMLPIYLLAFLILLAGFLLHWCLPQILGFKHGWERR